MMLEHKVARLDDRAALVCAMREPVIGIDSGKPRVEQEGIHVVDILPRADGHTQQRVRAAAVTHCKHARLRHVADALQNQVIPLVRRCPVVRHLHDDGSAHDCRAAIPSRNASAARWHLGMVKAAQAMALHVIRVEKENVLDAFGMRCRVEPHLARERGLLRPAARGVDERDACTALLIESVLPNDFRLRIHAIRAKCLRVNVVTKPSVKRRPFVPLFHVRPVRRHHLPREREGYVRLAVVHRVVAQHE